MVIRSISYPTILLSLSLNSIGSYVGSVPTRRGFAAEVGAFCDDWACCFFCMSEELVYHQYAKAPPAITIASRNKNNKRNGFFPEALGGCVEEDAESVGEAGGVGVAPGCVGGGVGEAGGVEGAGGGGVGEDAAGVCAGGVAGEVPDEEGGF